MDHHYKRRKIIFDQFFLNISLRELTTIALGLTLNDHTVKLDFLFNFRAFYFLPR